MSSNYLSYQIISTYLSCLDEEEISKLDLNETSGSLSLFSHKPTYNYPSFLRHLSYSSFFASILEWCVVHNNLNPNALQKIVQVLFLLFAKFSSNLETLAFVMDVDDNIAQDFNRSYRTFGNNYSSINSTVNSKRNLPILRKSIMDIKY